MIVRPARSIERPSARGAVCPRPTATICSPSTCTQPSTAESASPSSTSPFTNHTLTASIVAARSAAQERLRVCARPHTAEMEVWEEEAAHEGSELSRYVVQGRSRRLGKIAGGFVSRRLTYPLSFYFRWK